jgi:two-component system, OmpR family, alkaline phosphatase synthesis response regulator PhoP
MPTILIADDELHILELVSVTLEGDGVQVISATDGLEALNLAQRLCPDVILLDVHMPGLDGFEVCRRLRQDPRLTGTNIIMLTAAAQDADAARGLAAGADHYLTKPFSPIRLLSVIRSFRPECVTWLPR